MELATAALGSLLPKLGELLSGEYKLQKGVRGEIMFLKAEMEGIHTVLNKVSKLPAHQIDDNTKIWVRDLKELSYDMEDSVENFKVHIDAPTTSTKPHSFKRFIDRTVGLFTRAKNRHHIADDIEDIKRRLREVNERKDQYRLDGIVAQADAITMDPRLPGVYEEVAKLVGIDGPTKKLTDLLGPWEEGVQNLKVVPVVGMGGLGKTTIARLVHERLRGQFGCQAFVSVSLRPNMTQILGSILRQVSKNQCTNAGEQGLQELIENIRELLKNNRYFIVIDDVWSEEAWRTIKCALIDNNLGSKVIVTTRHVDVAKLSSTHGTIYELDPLSNEDSKKLLYKRVFNVEEGIHSEFEEISMKILKKCGGIPLAIITTASLLASKSNKTKNEWYSVYYSMGSGLEKNKTLDNMRDILCLSYNDLPSYLKPCLLYLSIFPEDMDIPRSWLVRLWIAEGFIDEKQGNTLYEIGENYFNELVNRSMIQAVTVTNLNDIYDEDMCCRVHDMVLDLISSISTEENFLTKSEGPELRSQERKIRRLIVQSWEENKYKKQPMLPETMDMSHVRTLFVLGDNSLEWIPPLSRFSVLRILVGADFSCGNSRPKDLGSLHHLRYLFLGGEPETEVLEQIGNLKFLKILDIGEAFIPELPASITQLSQLEHLIMMRGVKLPDGIGYLTSLQELSWLDVRTSRNSLAELGKLTELRVLHICGLDDDDDNDDMMTFLQALSNLGNIHTLRFGGSSLSLDHMLDGWRAPAHLQSILCGPKGSLFTRLPLWFSSLKELSSLSINVRKLKQDDFCLLGALPVLRFLRLKVHVYGTAEEQLVIGTDQPFPSLAEFVFRHRHTCWLVFTQGVMPKLQRLQLYFKVPKSQGGRFDIGLENLTSLEHVTLKLYWSGARMNDVENAETNVRDAISIHPNRPTLKLSKVRKSIMITDYLYSEPSDGSEA